MKILRHLIVGLAVILFVTACQSTPNHMHDPVNSAESGSNAAIENDTGTNHFDTLHPVQPNGMDTSGEQTGRMNNTLGTKGTTNGAKGNSGKSDSSK